MTVANCYRRLGFVLVASALGVAATVAALIMWLGRDETLLHGSAYGFTVGMTKSEVLGVIKAREGVGTFIYTGPPGSRPAPPDLRPAGELARSDYWCWALPGVPIDCHEFYFQDGRLERMVTKKRLFETP